MFVYTNMKNKISEGGEVTFSLYPISTQPCPLLAALTA